VFRTVKLFDLGLAPAFIQNAIRPIAFVHLSKMDGCAIWEVTVGSYDWQDAAEEWALHRWLRENGALEGRECSAAVGRPHVDRTAVVSHPDSHATIWKRNLPR
jgi:hypothetical protein